MVDIYLIFIYIAGMLERWIDCKGLRGGYVIDVLRMCPKCTHSWVGTPIPPQFDRTDGFAISTSERLRERAPRHGLIRSVPDTGVHGAGKK